MKFGLGLYLMCIVWLFLMALAKIFGVTAEKLLKEAR